MIRRLLCAFLGHVPPHVEPTSWWLQQGAILGPCRRCGERKVWRLS